MSSTALDDLLMAMQRQTEVPLWNAFRAAMKERNCGRQRLRPCEKEDMARWATRINRREIFGRLYKPSVGETEEVELLLTELGIISSRKDLLGFSSHTIDSMDCSYSDYSPCVMPLGHAAAHEDVPLYHHELIRAKNDSVIIKRSPVMIQPDTVCNVDGSQYKLGTGKVGSLLNLSNMVLYNECPERELILLTHHFIVATVQWSGKGASAVVESKRVDSCEALIDIVAVMNLDMCSASSRKIVPVSECAFNEAEVEGKSFYDRDEYSFRILTKSNRSYTFVCTTSTQKAAWMNAFQHAVIGSHTRSGSSQISEKKIGWRHLLIRKDIYSASVCGDEQMLRRCLTNPNRLSVNKRDSEGYTALHYAVTYGNVNCISTLLDFDADPNVLDNYRRTPLNCAVAYKDFREREKMVILLEQRGACVGEEDQADENSGISCDSIEYDSSTWLSWISLGFL